jgi:hypothetical protein
MDGCGNVRGKERKAWVFVACIARPAMAASLLSNTAGWLHGRLDSLDTRKCGWYGRHGMARYDHKAIHVTEWTGMEWHNDGVTALDF